MALGRLYLCNLDFLSIVTVTYVYLALYKAHSYSFVHLFLLKILWDKHYYYSCISYEESEAQRGLVSCTWQANGRGKLKLRPLDFSFKALPTHHMFFSSRIDGCPELPDWGSSGASLPRPQLFRTPSRPSLTGLERARCAGQPWPLFQRSLQVDLRPG